MRDDKADHDRRRHRHRLGVTTWQWAPRFAGAAAILAVATSSFAPRVQASSTTSRHPVGSARGARHASPTTGLETVGQWTTYGGSSARLSDQPTTPPLLPIRSRWISPRLDGTVDGQPLLDDGRVYVATERDVVYALDASNGHVAWRDRIGTPAAATDLPCGDIGPTNGVTSTMVLDPSTAMLYASAETSVSGSVRHEMVALDATTGAVSWRRDLDRPGWDAAAQLQRAALALDDGYVLAGFGGNDGDCGNYHGWVVGVPESGTGPTIAYEVPTAREGAIWAPAGISVARDGDVYVATGNGSSTSTFDHGDSVVELTPRLRPVTFFAPSNWVALNATDGDLGSTAPLLLPGERVFMVGKGAVAYLLSARRLGGIGHEIAQLPACFAIGGDAYLAPDAFLPCVHGTVAAVRVGTRSLATAWRSRDIAGSSPTVASGVVWVLGDSGRLVGLSPRTGRVIVDVPSVTSQSYAAPSVADGLVVVGGRTSVEAFEGPDGYVPSR